MQNANNNSMSLNASHMVSIKNQALFDSEINKFRNSTNNPLNDPSNTAIKIDYALG